MRRNKFISFIFLSLIVWAVLTYYIFIHHPLSLKSANKETQIEQRLGDLEKKLQEQFAVHELFIKELKSSITEQYANDEKERKLQNPKQYVDIEEKWKKQKEDEEINRIRQLASKKLPNGGPVIAVIVFACTRVTVSKCLDQLLRYLPSRDQFPIIVSQDCGHQPTADVIASLR